MSLTELYSRLLPRVSWGMFFNSIPSSWCDFVLIVKNASEEYPLSLSLWEGLIQLPSNFSLLLPACFLIHKCVIWMGLCPWMKETLLWPIVSKTQSPSADLTVLTLNFLKGHLERLCMCEIPLMCLLCLYIICKRKQKKNRRKFQQKGGHQIPFKPWHQDKWELNQGKEHK